MRNSALAHALSFLPIAAALALGVYCGVSLSAAALTVAVQVAKHGPNAPVQAPALIEQSSTIEN